MRVDAVVRRQVRDPRTEKLTFRLASGSAVDLNAQFDNAVSTFLGLWDTGSPLGEADDGPLPPPLVFVVATPPDLVVTIDKLLNVPRTFDLLLHELERALPDDARVSPVPKPRMPGTDGRPVSFVELRVALLADVTTVPRQTEATQHKASAVGARFLDDVGPGAAGFVSAPGSHAVNYSTSDTAAAITAQRDYNFYGTFTAVLGDEFRRADFQFRNPYLSLLVGRTGEDTSDKFDAIAAVETLLETLRPLEAVTQTAFLHAGVDLTFTSASAFLNRDVAFLRHRQALSTGNERLLEETGIVDAQGLIFVSQVPRDIDPRWAKERFGHLTKITTPDWHRWFSGPPSHETIEAGRRSLAPLLQNHVFDFIKP